MAMDLASIREFVAPIVASLGLDLYDVELTGVGHSRAVRIVVAQGGAEHRGGVDLDTISDATRVLAPALSASGMLRDTDVLEVSSPGLERTLRRPEHFRAAVGALVSVKHLHEGETVRDRGTIVAVDDQGLELAPDDALPDPAAVDSAAPEMADHERPNRRIAYADIVACRTVFEWGPAPRPGRGSKPGKGSARRAKENSRS
jgi:ribosome maturation factor RimP